MNSKLFLTPTNPKKVTSLTFDEDVREWIVKNVPERKRSAFINSITRRYIKRYEAAHQQEQRQTA